MLRFLDAGESHGPALTAIVEGLPAGFAVREEKINEELRRRQKGYGRGGRMAIEEDRVEILSGLAWGKTTGAPVTLLLRNRDYENWKNLSEDDTAVHVPRPGHGDLTGEYKYATGNLRHSIERSSARETAIRTAVGALCRQILEELGMTVRSKVHSLYGLFDAEADLYNEEVYGKIEESPMRVLTREEEFKSLVDSAKREGDTLGGWIRASLRGCPRGVGSFMAYDRRLDAQLAFAAMSIQGIKEVAVGNPFHRLTGSQYHDGIRMEEGKLKRLSNHAGGIEGGISNGEDIELWAYMKPIPSVKIKLPSVNLSTGENTDSRYERSDVTAVVPGSIVLENVLAFEILKAVLLTFSPDNKKELEAALNYRNTRQGEFR